jgi:hypothetical protein
MKRKPKSKQRGADKRRGSVKQTAQARSYGEKIEVSFYGRSLSAIERLAVRVTALRLIGEDEESVWNEEQTNFAQLMFPALRSDNRKMFKELIAAMQWANITVPNPPEPARSKAAKLRNQVLRVSRKTLNDPKALKTVLENRGIDDFDESDLARAKRQVGE